VPPGRLLAATVTTVLAQGLDIAPCSWSYPVAFLDIMQTQMLTGYEVLRNRNYRLFWTGQWVSLIGTWMQSVTQAWLLTRLTESPLALGVLGAASSAPLLLLVLFGGLVADRTDRRHLIMLTQTLSLLQALLLAVLTLAGVVRPWHIIALAAALGAINAFDIPARQSFVVELVGPTHLPNAIALNSTGFNVARVVGPAIGGLLVAAVGEGTCFLLNALSYVAVLWGLWLIPGGSSSAPPPNTRDRGALTAGVRYVTDRSDLGAILVLVGVVSAIGIPYRTFLPIMARTVLGVGAWRYGLLMAAAGVGAGIGGFIQAGLRLRPDSYRRLLPASLVGFSLALMAFASSHDYRFSLLWLALVGCGGITYFNCSNTLVQLSVEDAYRGRVMSLYALMHQGTATVGSLVLGLLADHYSTPTALLTGAIICLAAVGVFVARDRLQLVVARSAGPSFDA
jgi:predicted MFS family arabinose efflux permease